MTHRPTVSLATTTLTPLRMVLFLGRYTWCCREHTVADGSWNRDIRGSWDCFQDSHDYDAVKNHGRNWPGKKLFWEKSRGLLMVHLIFIPLLVSGGKPTIEFAPSLTDHAVLQRGELGPSVYGVVHTTGSTAVAVTVTGKVGLERRCCSVYLYCSRGSAIYTALERQCRRCCSAY